MYWNKILQEVVGKNIATKRQRYGVTHILGKNIEINNDINREVLQAHDDFCQSDKQGYCLGPKYRDTYFTRREAECMMMLLRGRTINRVAVELKLSPRTIEFYLKNMKAKVGCRTKFELIELVLESSFLQNIDFV